MTPVVALAVKDIRILLRDRLGFFFTLFWPLLMAVVFGAMFANLSSGPESIAVAVVDDDRTSGSTRFAERLRDAPALEIELLPREQALDQVRRGGIAVMVALPPGFGAALDNPFATTPRVEMTVDPTQSAVAGMIRGILLEAAAAELQTFTADPARLAAANEASRQAIAQFAPPSDARDDFLSFLDLSGRVPELIAGMNLPDGGPAVAPGGFGAPIQIDDGEAAVERRVLGPPNSFAASFPQALLWVLIGGSVSFSVSIAVERGRGTLMRLLVSPITTRHLLASKGLASLAVTLGASSLLLALGVGAFGVRPTSWPLLALALVSASVCFCGIMMALSVLGRTEQGAAGIGWGLSLPLSMLGGGMVPLFLMPDWMQQLANVSPIKWALVAYEGAIWRDFALTEMLLPCALLVGVGVVAFTFGASKLRWEAG